MSPPGVRNRAALAAALTAALFSGAVPARAANGQPLALADAVQMALATDPRLKAAGHATQAAEHERKASEALKLPRISVQNVLRDSDAFKRYKPLGPNGLLLSDIENNEVLMTGAVLDLPVYAGDRLAILPRMAQQKKDAQQQHERRISQDLVLELTGLYLDLLVVEKELKLEAERRQQKEQELEQARQKAANDALGGPRVIQLTLDLDELRQKQAALRVAEGASRRRLAQLVGRPEAAGLPIAPEFAMRELESTADAMSRIARAENPDVRLLEIATAAAGEGIGLAASDEKLQVNFRADYFDERPLSRPENRSDVWSVALVSSWNLFDGGAVDQEKKKARRKLQEAKAELAAGVQQLDLQIRDASSNLSESKQLLAALEKSVPLARTMVQTVTDKYEVNVMTRADLLESRSHLLRAIVHRDRARASVLKTKAVLFRLMGRLEPGVFQTVAALPEGRG